MILCDTNILIEIFRKNLIIRSELDKIGYKNIVISDVTRAELFIGAKNKIELQTIRKHLSTLHTLHIKSDISEIAVKLIDEYCLSHSLKLADALIAATAIYHDIELFTLNLKDFKYIPNIKLHKY